MNFQEQSDKISSLLKTINKNMHKSVHELIESYGITFPQMMVLKALLKEGDLPISEISKRLGLTNSTISGIIDRLEKEGYVERKRDSKDRRVVYVCLTEKTHKIKRNIPVFRQDYYSKILEKLGPEKVDQIIDALSILANLNISDEDSNRVTE